MKKTTDNPELQSAIRQINPVILSWIKASYLDILEDMVDVSGNELLKCQGQAWQLRDLIETIERIDKVIARSK